MDLLIQRKRDLCLGKQMLNYLVCMFLRETTVHVFLGKKASREIIFAQTYFIAEVYLRGLRLAERAVGQCKFLCKNLFSWRVLAPGSYQRECHAAS